ncbi:DDB1- and CUL4-associated factor 8 isoform X2 [Eurosta solidaginis]|uniref:DDB1- and CUL4-associated factor 8 isoform X2 n=1 Tax=Eurosta solidaginis TaxID=178769 RepID=UPI0035308749
MDNMEQKTNEGDACSKVNRKGDEVECIGDADDDKSEEIAMETVEVLLAAAVTGQTDDNSSESKSFSTTTKSEKSSSDSGVCVNMESRSIVQDEIDADLVTNGLTEMEVTNGTDTMQSSSPLSSDVIQVSSCITTPTKDEQQTKSYEIKLNLENNTNIEQSSTNSVFMETETTDIEVGVNNNIAAIPTWPRHTRRSTRNYRHSTQDDDNEDNIYQLQNRSVVDGTDEEEKMPLLVASSAATEGAVETSNVESMPSETERSAVVSSNRASRLPSVSSNSLLSADGDVNLDRDHDDSDNDDDDDEATDGDVDDFLYLSDDDTESDERDPTGTDIEHANTVAEILNKPKPQYTWSSTLELMRREHGLSGDGRRSLGSGMSHGFNARFYAARHVVERMKISHCLMKHTGCVNCLNFNRAGDLLCSGSDDKRIAIWDWAQKEPKIVFKSGHTENIFQTKFVNSSGVLDIVSAGRDGQVRRSILPSSGGKPQTSLLYRHYRSVHKLVMSPSNPFEVISAGEDAHIRRKDLRTDDSATSICKVESCKKKRKIRLFSISHHPYAPEICVCGCDNFVRVYDKRSMSKPVHQMCPDHLVKEIPQVTSCVYNSTGSEVLASYSDDHIYLFNNNEYKTGEYLHRYRGHYNHKTIKGVNFFGPNSEYIISGSDCGNIFFWDKNTEAIINFMPGDSMGVVNCLEPHSAIPVLATSGLDSSIKIWTPSSEKYPPDLSKLETCVKHNLRPVILGGFDDREFHYFIRQFIRRPPRDGAFLGSDDSADRQSTSSSSSSEADSDGGLDCPQMEGIQCHAQ